MISGKRIIVLKNNNSFIYFYMENDKLMEVKLYEPDKFCVNDLVICKVESRKKELNAYFVKLSKDINGILFDEDNIYNNTKIGDEFVVQIKKEAHDNKVAVVSTSIEIAGKYCVVKRINESGKINFSKKIPNEYKEQLIANLEYIDKNNVQILLRTASAKLENANLVKDEVEKLCSEIDDYYSKANHLLLYSRINYNSLVSDSFFDEADEIICLDDDSFEMINLINVSSHAELCNIIRYKDDIDPVVRYGLQGKLDNITEKKVWINSGSYLFIEKTQAMIVIDVNLGKAEYKGNKEDATLKANIDAANEIAYQIKARNLSGIIIIDFINMYNNDSKTMLINEIKKACSTISPPVKYVDITKLGLVELTREKKSIDIYEILKKTNKTILL